TPCFLAMALWGYALAGRSLVGFTILRGPMLDLPGSFWAAFSVVFPASLMARRPLARLVSLVALLCIAVFSLPLIEPFGHLIDSGWNVSYAARVYQTGSLTSTSQPYVASYPGSFILFVSL